MKAPPSLNNMDRMVYVKMTIRGEVEKANLFQGIMSRAEKGDQMSEINDKASIKKPFMRIWE